MTNNSNGGRSQGGFLSGFLWGALVGGGIVFLLGTKKGKEIIKSISEEGLELSELFKEEDEEAAEEVGKRKSSEKMSLNGEANSQELNGALTKITATGRRFFKGIPKRRGF